MAGLGALNNYDDWRKRAGEIYRKPLGDTGNYVDDFMGRHGFQPVQASANYEETKDNGWLGWAKDAMDSGAASVLAGQARFGQVNSPFGGDMFKAGAEYLEDVVQKNARTKFQEPELTNVNYWLDPQGAWYDVNNMLGSMGALGAETAAVVGATSVSPLAGAVGAAATKVPAVARLWSSPLGKLVIGNVATTPFEAISEGGNVVGQMLEEGYSEDEIQAAVNKAAGMNVAFLGLSNALQSFGATKLLGLLGNPAKAGAKEIVKKGIMGAAGGGITNAGEEAGQSAIGYVAQGKEIDLDDIIASAKAGLVGGVVLGGAGGAGGAALSGRQNTAKPTSESSVNTLERVRALQGKLPYVAEDGTNCMRTMGLALQGTPFEGQINVDQAVATAEETGLLMDPAKYTPKAGDMAVVEDGNHVVMVTEDGGTIQNGASHNGIYESTKSPAEMFGKVKYYIQSSVYSNEAEISASRQYIEAEGEDAAPITDADVLKGEGFRVETEQKEGVQDGQISENNKNQNSEFKLTQESENQNGEKTDTNQTEVLNRQEAARRSIESGHSAEAADFLNNIRYPNLTEAQAQANVRNIKRQTAVEGGFMPDSYYTNTGEFKDKQKIRNTISELRQKHLDQKWYGMERDKINAGLEETERDAVDFITSLHPDNPAEGLKIERTRLQDQYDSMLDPVIDELKSGMKQGVEVIRPNGEGGGYRESRNAQWYRDFYAQSKRPPNKEELRQIAYEVLTGESNALPDWRNTDAESAAYFKESKEALDGLQEQIAALDSIKNKMPEKFNAVDDISVKPANLLAPTADQASFDKNIAGFTEKSAIIEESKSLYDKVLNTYRDISNGNERVMERVERAIQGTLDFGTGEGELRSASGETGRLASVSAGLSGRPSGRIQSKQISKTLGIGITRALVNDGAFSLVGHKITSLQDLAEYAQVLRHPGYEKFHRVYVNNRGKIIGHETVTSMLPAESRVWEGENGRAAAIRHLEKLNSSEVAGVYYIHNHPSTIVKPSIQDIEITKWLASDGVAGRKFKGHIILDTSKYTLIDFQGNHDSYEIPDNKQIRYDIVGAPHKVLGKKLNNPDAVARAIKTLEDTSKTTAFITDTQLDTRAVVQLPDGIDRLSEAALNKYLRWIVRSNYGSQLFISTADETVFAKVKELVRRGRIVDAILTKDREVEEVVRDNISVDNDKTFFGIDSRSIAAERVLDKPDSDYQLTKKNAEEVDTNKLGDRHAAPAEVYSINHGFEELSPIALDDWEAQAKEAFPGMQNFARDGSVMQFDLPNGQHMQIDVVERIVLDDSQFAKASDDYNGKIGRSDDVLGSIRIVGKNAFMTLTQDNVRGTIDHEAFHYARTHGLTERENTALNKTFKSDEEAMAEAYRKWRISWKERKIGSEFGKLWRKLYDFAATIGNILGFESKHDIFRKVESGEVWSRESNESNTEGFKLFSLFNPKEQEKWKNYGKKFREQVESALDTNVFKNKVIKVCDTPLLLQELNVPDLPIKMHLGIAVNTTKSEGAAKHSHGLTLDMIEQIPQALNEPVFVMKSATQSGDIVVFTDIKDAQGKSVVVPLTIQKDIGRGSVANVIKSIYGKDNEDLFVAKQVLAKNLLYVNKEKSLGWVGEYGLQLPDLLTKQSSLLEKSISEKLKAVNNAPDDAKYSIFSKKLQDADQDTTSHKIAGAFKNTERKGTVQSVKEWIADKRKNLYRDWIDKNDSLHELDNTFEKESGRVLTEDEKLYNKAQTMKAHAAGMANALIEGDEESIKAINSRLKNKQLPHVATLSMALNKVDRKVMDGKYSGYLKNNGFTNWVDALGSYLGSIRLLEMDKLHKEAYQQEVQEWEANGSRGKKPVFKPYKMPAELTEGDLREFIKRAPQEFKEAASLYWKFNDNLLTVMEDAGMLSAEAHELLNTKYKYYAPLMRDFSDTAAADSFIGGLGGIGKGIANVSSTLKKISVEGSERGIINPLESSIKAAAVVCGRAERNKVGQMAVALVADGSMGNVIWKAEGKSADPKNCIFTIMEDGKKVAYQTIPELYGPIAGYNEATAGFVLGIARSSARLLRAGATSSPSFIVRNLIRDTFFAGVSSKTGFVPFVDTVRGMYALAKNPQLRAEYEAAGVTQFNFYGSSEAITKSLDEMAGGKAWQNYGARDLWHALMKYPGMLSEFVESSSRMGEFMRARKQGVSIDEAARYARELTLDFSRSGVHGEKVNQIVPFFNACLQGGDKMIRLLKDDPVGTATALGKYIVLPSVLLWALNHDEDWYKELDPNIKNTCWCLPGGIRIPKPQEAGVFFGSGIEMILDMATNADPEAMGAWGEAFKDAALPNFVPTIFLPLLEWQANYSYFRGQPITGKRLERLPDEMQFNPGTSEVAKAIGHVLKVSPVKIDNTIRGYTGTMGMFFAQSLDSFVAEKRNMPAKKISEITFVRDFTLNDNLQNRSVNDFYDMLDVANKQHAGYGMKGKPIAAVKAVRKAGQLISDANKDIRNITTSSALSPDEKRVRIDKKKAYIQNVAKMADAKFGKYFK